MAPPFTIERDSRRDEIDFALAQQVSFTAIGAHYGIDQRTVSAYRRRMVDSQPRYFDRLRIGHRLPPHQAFLAAAMFAEHNRADFLRAAEAFFSH